uniref:Uncharacterized protein n=1 Tax=Panagrolaimus sp. JU765 TaxID=591449 RepID=A0AC34RB79_9BILA
MSSKTQDYCDSNSKLKRKNLNYDFNHWYLQYCLCTGLYMLEPWERTLFNTFVLSLTAIGLYFWIPFVFGLVL